MRRIIKPNRRLICPHCKCSNFSIHPCNSLTNKFMWRFRCCDCGTMAHVEEKETKILVTNWLMRIK